MYAVGLHQFTLEGHLVEQERKKCHRVLGREPGEHVAELLAVTRAVVRWYEHADQQHAGLRVARQFDDAREILATGIERQPAQPVVATELDDHDGGLVGLERAWQPGESALRGFAAHAGVDHAVSVPFGGEPLREQVYPALLNLDAIPGAQTVA